MKKYSFFLILLSFLFLIPSAKASHVMGGEISWKCLNNGQYVFYMTIYRDCTGAPWSYTVASIQIFGSPLPKSSSNQSINTILLSPDSALWLQRNKGDLSPSTGNVNNQLRCDNRDTGALQAYYYQSNTIVLNGKPPVSGWKFIYTPPCCRPFVTNLADGATPIFKASLYPYKDTTKTGCQANAPVFPAKPIPIFCLKTAQKTLNYVASAQGADSVTYHWDEPRDTPASNPTSLNYTVGYSKSNPLPDTSFDINNKVAELDSSGGVVEFATFSGGPQPKKYLLVVRADAWKDGNIYASAQRELPVILFDCPTLANNQINRPPNFSFNGQQQQNYKVHLKAGDKLTLPMLLQDQDSAANGNSLQNIRMLSFDAEALSKDRADTAACDEPPCAVFENNIPQFDSTLMGYQLGGTKINTVFSWQPNFNHLLSNGSSKAYHFYLYVQDLFGSIPSAAGSYINVIVEPLAFRGIINQNGTLMSVDSLKNYQWYDCDADTIITNETNRTYTPNRNGNFAFITTSGTYSDTADCFLFTSVGIEKAKLNNQFRFYPNPTNGKMTIAFNSNKKNVLLNVRNIYGQIVQKEKFEDVSNVSFVINGASGIYVVEVIDEKGEKANFKVVKN